MPGGTYNNLNVNNTSLTNTANADMVVNGALVTLGGTMAMGTNKLSGTLSSITIGGTLSTQYTGNPSLPTGKNWQGATGLISFAAASGIAGVAVQEVVIVPWLETFVVPDPINWNVLMSTFALEVVINESFTVIAASAVLVLLLLSISSLQL